MVIYIYSEDIIYYMLVQWSKKYGRWIRKLKCESCCEMWNNNGKENGSKGQWWGGGRYI